MRLISTPLLENRKLKSWKNEQGFSLLEVVVALTILAGGFLTVLNLFSGSVLSHKVSQFYIERNYDLALRLFLGISNLDRCSV